MRVSAFKMFFKRLRHFFLVLATVLTLVLAFLLLSSLMVVWFKPSFLGGYVYIGFIFPALFIINILSFVYWVIRWRVQMLIPLGALVFTWSLWSVSYQSGSESSVIASEGRELKILSYNVRMFDLYKWTKRANSGKMMLDFINKSGADVICIQEFLTGSQKNAFTESQLSHLLSNYPYSQIFYGSNIGNLKYGLAVFTRYPIVNKKNIDFEQTSNSAMSVDVDVEGTRVRVFNLHLESLRLDKSQLEFLSQMNYPSDQSDEQKMEKIDSQIKNALKARTNQALRINALVEHSPYRTFVCGDFNDVPISYVYRTIKGDLKDSFLSHGSGFGGTYYGFNIPFRIDYILHDDEVECVDYKRFNILHSDHLPIMGSYLIK